MATTTTTTVAETTTAETTEPQPSGSPELIWVFQYENIDFAPKSLAMYPEGELELWRLSLAEPLPKPAIDIYQPVPIPGDVLFDTGSSELKAEADEVIRALAEDHFSALSEAKLTFVGHTDSRGDASANMRLSLDWATSVKDWFEAWAEDTGADGWTFAVDGKGETELKAPDSDEEGNFREEAGRVNRRVEIEVEPVG